MDASQTRPPVIIVGAGLTGLAAAYHLRSPYLLVEREAEVGGHARSRRVGGYTFDVTGHWLHLRSPRARALVAAVMEADALVEVERRTRVHSHGALLPYPFQANLFGLPLAVVQECLCGLVEARERAARGAQVGATFAEFAVARFGEGIARHFFVPYNRKLWAEHFDRLSAAWVAGYVPIPSVAEIIGGALGLPQEGLGYNARFLTPRGGGIDALPRALRSALLRGGGGELRTSCGVEEIDAIGRRVKLVDEPTWRPYEALISTMPLPELCARLVGAPAAVREAAGRLRWVRWRYLDVATRAPAAADYHWVYVPDPALPFFRVGVYSNACPAMAPPGCASLYVELSARDGAIDEAAVVAGLVQIGALARAEDLGFLTVREIEHAYVVFDDEHAAATATILGWLAGRGILSCGRYGAWTYDSMEGALLAGADAAAWADARRAA
ncbi:MAG: FAD-dependent oxidoreductase [Nannocystis sp.]|nr:FAD-dependent oxidoreductase [Nannocystis sp.]